VAVSATVGPLRKHETQAVRILTRPWAATAYRHDATAACDCRDPALLCRRHTCRAGAEPDPGNLDFRLAQVRAQVADAEPFDLRRVRHHAACMDIARTSGCSRSSSPPKLCDRSGTQDVNERTRGLIVNVLGELQEGI
jgi:hypothetical protein